MVGDTPTLKYLNMSFIKKQAGCQTQPEVLYDKKEIFLSEI